MSNLRVTINFQTPNHQHSDHMNKISITLIPFLFFALLISAQITKKQNLKAGIVLQKTQSLYWENGVGFDYSSASILDNKIHFKATFLSSRLGSAFNSNAIKQDNFIVGADWRFRSEKDLQILVGLNTGVFKAYYDDPIFDVLPNSAIMLSAETGLAYQFKFPLSALLTAGYNLRTGDGATIPGTLFPVFYKLGLYYSF